MCTHTHTHPHTHTNSSPEEGMWYWSYQDHELWFETGQPVRFKVEEVRFHAPLEPPRKGIAGMGAGAALPATPLLEQPMLVVGQAADSGLGMLAWWHQEPDDGDGDGDDEAAAEDEAAAP